MQGDVIFSSEDLYDQRFGWALDKIADAGARQRGDIIPKEILWIFVLKEVGEPINSLVLLQLGNS